MPVSGLSIPFRIPVVKQVNGDERSGRDLSIPFRIPVKSLVSVVGFKSRFYLSIPFRIPVERLVALVVRIGAQLSIPFRIPATVQVLFGNGDAIIFQFLSGFQLKRLISAMVEKETFNSFPDSRGMPLGFPACVVSPPLSIPFRIPVEGRCRSNHTCQRLSIPFRIPA